MGEENKKKGMHMTKKKFAILITSLVGIVLVGWGLLVFGIFGKGFSKSKYDNIVIGKYDIPDVPEGYALVFRETATYKKREGESRKRTMSAQYDKNGRLLHKTEYSDKGKKTSETVCNYTAKGSVMKETTYNEKGNADNILIEMYDANDQLTSVRKFDGQSREIRTEAYEYYGDGKCSMEEIIERTYYGEGDPYVVGEKTSYTYYPNGQKERALMTVEQSGEVFQIESFWEEDGRPLQDYEKNYYSYSCYRYEYNEQGKLVKKEGKYKYANSPDEGYFPVEENVYAKDGRLTKKTLRGSNYFLGGNHTIYYYDKFGNVIRELDVSFDNEGNVSEIMRETITTYDENGTFLHSVTTEKENLTEEINALPNGDREYKKYSFREDGSSYLSEEGVFFIKDEMEQRRTIIAYTESGEIDHEVRYEYDEEGNETRFIGLEKIYEFEDYVEIRLSGRKRPLKTIVKNMDGTIERYQIKEYDADIGYFISDKVYYAKENGFDEYIQYVNEYDEYDNNIRYIYHEYLEEDEQPVLAVEEYQYTPFVIPVDQLSSAERKKLGLNSG